MTLLRARREMPLFCLVKYTVSRIRDSKRHLMQRRAIKNSFKMVGVVFDFKRILTPLSSPSFFPICLVYQQIADPRRRDRWYSGPLGSGLSILLPSSIDIVFNSIADLRFSLMRRIEGDSSGLSIPDRQLLHKY